MTKIYLQERRKTKTERERETKRLRERGCRVQGCTQLFCSFKADTSHSKKSLSWPRIKQLASAQIAASREPLILKGDFFRFIWANYRQVPAVLVQWGFQISCIKKLVVTTTEESISFKSTSRVEISHQKKESDRQSLIHYKMIELCSDIYLALEATIAKPQTSTQSNSIWKEEMTLKLQTRVGFV